MNEIIKQMIEEAAEQHATRRFNTRLLYDMYGRQSKSDFLNGATFALQNQWISVQEALPPSDDRLKSISIDVMVKNEYGKVTSAWYDYERKEWHLSYGEIAGDDLIDSKITHWMEIQSLKGGEE